MRLLRLAALTALTALPLALSIAACTAQGSSTTVTGPTSPGGPLIPGLGNATDDGGPSPDPGGTDYDALFGPPTSTKTTANSLNGLWAGSSGLLGSDTRVVFSGSSITIAQKCSGSAVGLEVAAQVTSSSIKTLESKSAAPSSSAADGGKKSTGACSLSVTPLEVTRCTSTTDGNAESESAGTDGGCFFLSGTKLSFYDSGLLGPAKLTKLSD